MRKVQSSCAKSASLEILISPTSTRPNNKNVQQSLVPRVALKMYNDMQTPQILYPPPSLTPISPPPQLYTPPNPTTVLSLLTHILSALIHFFLAPFSTRLIPTHPSHPYALDLAPQTATPTAIVPTEGRKERRSRSKSPSASVSSVTLTEGTVDGQQPGMRKRGGGGSGFEAGNVKIRAGRGKVGVKSKLEGWANEAFGM